MHFSFETARNFTIQSTRLTLPLRPILPKNLIVAAKFDILNNNIVKCMYMKSCVYLRNGDEIQQYVNIVVCSVQFCSVKMLP